MAHLLGQESQVHAEQGLHHERKPKFMKFTTAIFALAWLVLVVPMAASAGSDTEPYLDGDVKEAIASGETVLLHYKSTW